MPGAVVMSKKGAAKIDTIEIDVITDENHTMSNSVTDHPVEKGSNISDHSRPDPDVVQLTCVVGNTPFPADGQTRKVDAGGGNTLQSITSGPVELGATDGRADQAWRAIKKLRDDGSLIKVVTTVLTYDSVVVQQVSRPVNSKNYDALEFSITLKKIRVVQNKFTRTVVAVDPRAHKKVKTGAQTTKPPEIEQSRLDKGYEKSQGKTGAGWFGAFGAGIAGF